MNIGIVGCGNISGQYFKGCKPFPHLSVAACADLDMSRAKAKAQEFGVPRACTVEEMLKDPKIELIVNLTIPKAHAEVNQSILRAGKHAYCEKPLGVTREEGRRTVALAREMKLRLGCAPDTFLGGGIQTCRKLIDDGAIGTPIAATAFMTCHGHESWHPAPEFYYESGGGPMLDMGPYYLTALVNLMGPIKRVAGATRITFPERTAKSGKKIKVEVPTHLTGTLDFASGAIGTIVMSFDVWAASLPFIEVYGSEGTLSVPDPNNFGGVVRLNRNKEWKEVPLAHSDQVGRGIGVADMAQAIASGKPHRASGELAYHVLDVMCAFDESSKAGKHISIESTCNRPEAL
jgi:predicted dehydrogenase